MIQDNSIWSRWFAGLIIFTLFLSGCRASEVSPATEVEADKSTITDEASKPTALSPSPTITSTQIPKAEPTEITATPPIELEALPASEPIFYGYTHQRADGNRWVAGRGQLPHTPTVDITLAGEPAWLVAVPGEGELDTIWAIVLTDGRVQAFALTDASIQEVAISPSQLPPGMPPLLRRQADKLILLTGPLDTVGLVSHLVPFADDQSVAFIDSEGNVVVWQDDEVTRFEVNALPDARLLVDDAGRILLLTDATTRYGHGVLGDRIEAASITLIETMPTPQIALTIPIPGQTVVEGIAPIWADLTGDEQREIIVTLSNAEQGAQLVVYDETGQQIAVGPAIGRGNRWRHQLAVAPFGPNGELELVDVLTPHLGRITEFFSLAGANLQIEAQLQAGYTSHAIGSRNLDMAVAGDFDGEGQVELLLPNVEGNQLGAIRHTANGAEVVWTLPIDGRISTNLAAVALSNGKIAVGLGRADGTLRVWLP